jgi:hypothetical protein
VAECLDASLVEHALPDDAHALWLEPVGLMPVRIIPGLADPTVLEGPFGTLFDQTVDHHLLTVTAMPAIDQGIGRHTTHGGPALQQSDTTTMSRGTDRRSDAGTTATAHKHVALV